MSYGKCPECGANSIRRERRLDGNDKCENGHVFPSKNCIPKDSDLKLDSMPKTNPSGFVARCQCGKIVGAMDFNRTPLNQRGSLLGEWLYSGCTVEPRWGNWSETIEPCQCRL